MQIKSSQTLAKPCSKADESTNHDYILQRHAKQELLSSRQTLLREQKSQQDQFTSFKKQIKSSQTLAKPCSKADESANHDYILQRHAKQELLSSRQNLAEGADESARTRLHHSKCKQEHSSFAKPYAQGANELAKPRLTSNMQPLGLLPKTLLREQIISKTTFYKCACQEHSSSCKDLAQGRDQQDHVYIIQTCKHLGSCQTLLRERIASKTTFNR